MEPFFKYDERVEAYIDPAVREAERRRQEELVVRAAAESRELAQRANPITRPFVEAVAGSSS